MEIGGFVGVDVCNGRVFIDDLEDETALIRNAVERIRTTST